MRSRVAAVLLASTLTAGGVGALASLPASAASSVGNPVVSRASRLEHLKADLTGLVHDGTLTQAQADKVAQTLNARWSEGFAGRRFLRHHHRHHLMVAETAAAAKALGLSKSALRAELRSGKSLAQVAAAHQVSVETLVKDLVAVAQSHLDAAVQSGRLTQAQADRISSRLTALITRRVDRVRPAWPAHGPRPGTGVPGAGNPTAGSAGGGAGSAA